MDLKETILKGTIEVFNDKGLKFTMDDIAERLKISKKTLYKVFDDKEALFLAMVDYIFDSIKESEREVMGDVKLSTVEKIHKILGVLPEGYKDIDFRRLYLLKGKYPNIYKQVELRLETGWESTIALLEQGIAEGCIKPVKIPILKMMLEASIEQFFQRDVLVQNNITYHEALNEVVDILMDGITVSS
ncbi:MAG: TetR/AcrR family transcriptional regulator [Lachnospiraceae bacterium]|nr:TetR/AcrR family transcriptional regulator [Lachnospiraceae bacterium]